MRSLLLRAVYRFLRALRPRAQTSSAQTSGAVLVLHYQMPLGCCVHATPLFAAIKHARPGATLVVATRGLAAQTFQHDPHIDVLLETTDPRASRSSLFRTAAQLRRMLLDRNLRPKVILQPATDRAGSFAFLAQGLRFAPVIGFAHAPQLYDTHLAYDSAQSLIDNNLRLAEWLGAPPAHREPAVFFSPDDLTAAQTLLAEANPRHQPVCAFVMQGSGGQRTGWHEDRFASVIRHMEALGCAVVFLGTATDAALIARIATLAGSQGTSLAGRTTIPQLSALLANCDLLISVDTGTMHVGRAAGVPLVVLGPSWQQPLEWLPLELPQARILRGPDRSSVPPDYKLDEIDASSVIHAADDLLRTYPPSAKDRTSRTERLLSTTRAS
jgi:ADP-heptose:LPS heptosyltransferase